MNIRGSASDPGERRSVIDLQYGVGIGWHPLLEGLHAELIQAVGEYEALQVKEKWGWLRVYIKVGGEWKPTVDMMFPREGVLTTHEKSDSPWDQAMEIVHKWEHMSESVCEDCGEPGELRNDQRWLRTLCNTCNDARNARRSFNG